MGAVENVKEVADLIRKFNDIDLNRRIVNLENEVLDLSRDKRRLEEKVEELERTLKLRKDLYFYEPFYWMKGDTTPYCPRCWEAQNAAVHVTFGHDNNGNQAYSAWQCPSCQQHYYPKELRQYLIASATQGR
jgi:hypothetical protein